MMGSFPDCDVKLCDFEISRVILEGTEVREILGTPDYVGEWLSLVSGELLPYNFTCMLMQKIEIFLF